MSKCVGQGMLRGRPFGGTIIIIKKELLKVTQTVHCDERYVIIKVANYLFVNVYLPCVGTTNKLAFCDDILQIYARGVNITVIVEFLLLEISMSIWTIVPTPVAIAVKSCC